jgi:hypothetical protein
MRVLVEKGDRVIAGETVVATLPAAVTDDGEAMVHVTLRPMTTDN